jgi:hypothetical protein
MAMVVVMYKVCECVQRCITACIYAPHLAHLALQKVVLKKILLAEIKVHLLDKLQLQLGGTIRPNHFRPP